MRWNAGHDIYTYLKAYPGLDGLDYGFYEGEFI